MCVDGVDECCDGGIDHVSFPVVSLFPNVSILVCACAPHFIYIYIMNDFAIVYDAIVDYYYY